ncbi:MAG: Hsp70 family protein, partial [Acidobacteriota bacterium]
NQQSVEIHILQGEREIAEANRSLAKFELVGIPPAPRGVPQVEVSFEIDANGIVNVSAVDKMTGLAQAMQVTNSSGLAPDEIDRLISEAESSADRDNEAKEVIMQRNRLESLIKGTWRAMEEIGTNFAPVEVQGIHAVLNEAEKALTANDMGIIMGSMSKVEEVANKITEAMLSAV